MLSRFLSVTARRTRHQARRLHAGAGAVVAPPPQALVQSGIRPESLPRHVAVVTDGNRRWAKARGMLTAEGHEAGRRALEHTIWLSHAWGIRALTVFAFSQENFGRPKAWISSLPSLINFFTFFSTDANRSCVYTLFSHSFESEDGGRLLDGNDRADDPR